MYDENVGFFLGRIYDEIRIANKLKAIELLEGNSNYEKELKEIIDKR